MFVFVSVWMAQRKKQEQTGADSQYNSKRISSLTMDTGSGGPGASVCPVHHPQKLHGIHAHILDRVPCLNAPIGRINIDGVVKITEEGHQEAQIQQYTEKDCGCKCQETGKLQSLLYQNNTCEQDKESNHFYT